MNIKNFTIPGVLTLILLITLNIGTYAQQTGNIVEYFGRETVEEIEEGNVVHVFSKGLFLPVERFSGGLFTSEDFIAWQLANDSFMTPVHGQSPDNTQRIWETVEVNEEGQFQGRELRNSYVYTSIESSVEDIVLLDARGHTRVYINGMPYEGDHYDFGYTLIPFKLKKGLNELIYTPGRFGRVASKLVAPSKPVQLTRRDLTLPSIIAGENDEKWAAIRVINASEKDLDNLTISCTLESGETAELKGGNVMAMSVRKLKFLVPASSSNETGEISATVLLSDKSGREIDRSEITLQLHEADVHHERTFVSNIDGSVQYYSVAPSLNRGTGQALVLSVHGAGVEAKNQARAYRQKDWAHVVAATNRRPFGFNWEAWGRIDAVEVFEEAKSVFQTNDNLSYLTGHSMGGHGTWYLGVTYPDKFAAIAPCASYPDIIGYRRGAAASRFEDNPHYEMIKRGANPGRTLSMKRNYLQSGIYILHGNADRVVSVDQARFMRETLGEFHSNFNYYEYPDGSHWYGDHSVDWFPIFDFFKWQSIPVNDSVKHIEFHTASPAISATNYWTRINQQENQYEFSNIVFDRENDTIKGNVENVQSFTLFLSDLNLENDPVISIGEFQINTEKGKDITLQKNGDSWISTSLNTREKYAERSGGFKEAFNNNMVFVYATRGTREENEWYRNKARFDAETFLYKANGSVDIVADSDFEPAAYADRNVILYGNESNNRAWQKVLGSNVPVVIRNGEIEFGSRRTYRGDDLGAFFIFPRIDSETASVGVVGGTGLKGMRAAFANDYFSGITGFPDLLIFNTDMLKDGIDNIVVSGFFGNDWSVENGNFSY